MNKITREMIKHLASSDIVYFRGMRYYAAHAVSKVTWSESSKQYKSVVKGGNDYNVTIDMPDNGQPEYTCNCPAKVNQQGACKHVVATLLFISDYQERKNAVKTQNKGDKTAYEIVEYFKKREYRTLAPTYFRISLKISINECLKPSGSKAMLSLCAGSGRMYKIPNTKKFIKDIYDGNIIQMGKEFMYIPDECSFEPTSMRVIKYLLEIYEIQETLGKTYYSSLFNRHELVLSQKMLIRLLQLAEGLDVSLEFMGEKYDDIGIISGSPELKLKISVNEDSVILSGDDDESIYSICTDGTIILFNGDIYLPDEDFISNLLPFYTSLFSKESQKLYFRGDTMNSFIEKVLPVIKKTFQVDIPDSIGDRYVVEPLQPKLFLDMRMIRKKPVVTAKLLFCYGKYEINPLDEYHATNVIVVRDSKEEERLINLLYEYRFSVYGELFSLGKEDDIFALMKEGIPKYLENFEVYYTKDYKSIEVRKPGNIHGGLKVNSDINLLEMDTRYTLIPEEELNDFFKSIRLKRKYYRLKNGTFIDLSDEDATIRALRQLIEVSTETKEGKLRFRMEQIARLESILPKSNRIKKDESYKKFLSALKHPELNEYEIPTTLKDVLRPYQKVGFYWLKNLAGYGLGGILADDMGLGKTIQSIAYICSEPGSKSLIVCPTSLAFNWQEEFEKFAPHIKICIISGTPKTRKALLEENREQYDVWITTYPLIRKDAEIYQGISFDALFIDEAQFIKNPGSIGSKAVKTIKAKHRFALSGTPVENSLSELWSIFDFIMPGFFGSHNKFIDQYEKPIIKGDNDKVVHELQTRVKPFILRRMKSEVLRELPDKTEVKKIATMTSKQQKIYISYLSRIRSEMDESVGNDKHVNVQVLAALTRLRQICCHPGTFIENYSGGSGKMDMLMKQLPELLEQKHSVIIFSQFTSMLNIIGKELSDRGIPFNYMAGSTSPDERKREVKEFNKGKVSVFLISLKAGGTGLNLTGADTVIHFDPWWNPAVEEQATDRAYRIGQKKKVHVIRYVMEDSIEEKIYELQKRKRKLSEKVISSGEFMIDKLSLDDLKYLLEM